MIENPTSVATPPDVRTPWWMFWRRRPVVPVIRLAGAIGSLPLRASALTITGLERAIDQAFAVKHAPAVALIVNSPGGSPVQSSLMASRIRRLADERKRPVLAFVEDIAASGGYWLALAADEIYADGCSIIGSIGVVSAGFGFNQAMARLGIERRVHTTGEHKALLDPFRPERPEDVALLRSIQADIYERFKAEVRTRRGGRLKAGDEELFDGRVWTGARAVELGLIDGLGELRSVIRSRYGKGVGLRLINQPRRGLLGRLRLRPAPAAFAGELMAALDERLLLQRYGL